MGKTSALCSVLAVCTLTLSVLLVYHQIPRYSGSIEVNRNNHSSIKIERNSYGIPSVTGETFADVAYGIGYAHASDRLWTMHFKRRVCEGRLSEITGEQTLHMDRLFRQLKLDRNAKAKYEKLTPEMKTVLTAYADGINDYVASLYMLPLEFQIMFDTFEPWQPHSSLSLINLISFFLTLEMSYEPFRHMLIETYGEELGLRMMGSRDEFNIEMTTVIDDEDLKRMGLYRETTNSTSTASPVKMSMEYLKKVVQVDIVNMIDEVRKGIKGSNMWAISGNHTKSGKPLLANDPHLETVIPSIWYQAELIVASKDQSKKTQMAMGATLPGLPFIMIGRTDYIAWGITNNIIDSSDFYVETIKENKYLYNNEWHPVKQHNETIKVRLGDSFTFVHEETHHGPIITGMFNLIDNKSDLKLSYPLSVSWNGHIENERSMESLYNIMGLTSIEQVEQNFYLVSTSNLNIVYATTDNHIGYFAQGRLPIKNNPGMTGFRNGTNPENDWIGYLSFDEQPRVMDPAKGFIVSANNKIASDHLVHNVNKAQISIPRARRISDILSSGIKAGKKFSTEDFMAMQKDVFDVYASYIVAPIVEIYNTKASQYLTKAQREKIDPFVKLFAAWDFKLTKESVSASVFMAWEHYYLQSFFEEAGEYLYNIPTTYFQKQCFMGYMFDHFYMSEILKMKELLAEGKTVSNQTYCRVQKTNESGDCIKNLVLAFELGLEHLNSKHGSETHMWQWGLVHRHRFDHKPFSQTPLKVFFERSYIGEGNRRTINVGGVNHWPDNWDSWYSANYRQVVDLSEKNDSYFVLDTGISENVFSKHYDDQMILHETGRAIPMKFTSEKSKYEKPTYSLQINFSKNNKSNSSNNNNKNWHKE